MPRSGERNRRGNCPRRSWPARRAGSTHDNAIVQVQRAVHLRGGEHHDHRVDEVGAVGEPRERIDQPEGEELVDEGRRAGAALDDDEADGDGPGRVAEARVHRAHGDAQAARVEPVDQQAHDQRRDDPAEQPETLERGRGGSDC